MDWNKWKKDFEAAMKKVEEAEAYNEDADSQIVNSTVTESCDGRTYVNGKEYNIPINAHRVSIYNGVVKVNGKVISPIEKNKKEDIKEFKLKNCGPLDPLDEDNDLALTNLYLRKYDQGHIYKDSRNDKIYYAADDTNINTIDITASDIIKRDFKEINRNFGEYTAEDFKPYGSNYYEYKESQNKENSYKTAAEVVKEILQEAENISDKKDNSLFPADACMFDLNGKPTDEELFKTVTYQGHKLPKCPGMIVNLSKEVINIVETKDRLYCSGYELINGKWKKTFKAKLKTLFK